MSQYPPPSGAVVGGPYAGPAMPRANPAAIVSLVCGIVGCCVITPLVGIVTGVIGLGAAKRLGTGRVMAVAGILLSILWIIGGISGTVATYRFVKNTATAAQPTVIGFINDMANGDLEAGAAKSTFDLETLTAYSSRIQPMGRCTSLEFEFPKHTQYNDGVLTITLEGTGTFENDNPRHVTATLTGTSKAMKVNQIDIK